MKKLLLIIVLSFSFIFLRASDTLTHVIKEGNITVDLPNNNWKLYSHEQHNGMIIYLFKRVPITDSSGMNIIPNIGIIIETVDSKLDVVTYSVEKRANMPLDIDEMFIHEDGKINFKNAVGYKAKYYDPPSLQHTVYVIHAINKGKGIQFILDATTSVFGEVDKEFQYVIKSIRISGASK